MRFVSAAALAALALSTSTVAHADELKAHLDTPFYGASGDGGTIDFKLNADGTIAVTLTGAADAYGIAMAGSGYGALDTSSDFSIAGPQTTTWGTFMGSFDAGWIDTDAFSTNQFVHDITWTLGEPRSYTSVWQAVGAHGAQYDFLELTPSGYFAGNAVSAVPEAPSALMLAAGLGALALARRRARATTA